MNTVQECVSCGQRLDENWFGEPVNNRSKADPLRCHACAAERAEKEQSK